MVNFMRQRRNTPREDNGFVLITALMVIFLTISIVATVAAVTASDVKSSAIARTIIKTRFVAESASDAVFALIAREKDDYVLHAEKWFSVDPYTGGDTPENNPLYYSTHDPSGFGTVWFYFGDGRIIKCEDDDTENVCFVARMTEISSSAFARNEEVVLDVIARGGCISTGDPSQPLKNCVYRSFQQVFSTRTYVDQALIAGSEAGGLGAYSNVAYLPSDVVTGKVHTNGDSITYCGTLLDPPAFTARTGNAESEDFCGAGPAPDVEAKPQGEFLPGQIDKAGKNVDSSVFEALAGGASSSYYISGDGGWIELFHNGIKIYTASNPNPDLITYPPNGVMYVEGTVYISGEFSRGLSIYASGDVLIFDDITYRSSDGSATFTGDGGTLAADDLPPDAILGIATPGEIVLACGDKNPNPVTATQCDSRHVVAVLDAPYGRVYNNSWGGDNPGDGAPVTDWANPPRAVIYGSIISYYHPVFGSYFSTPSAPGAYQGALENGWAKTIMYDPRLADQQPPYFFRTSQANVVRSTLDESPCKSTVVYASGGSICI